MKTIRLTWNSMTASGGGSMFRTCCNGPCSNRLKTRSFSWPLEPLMELLYGTKISTSLRKPCIGTACRLARRAPASFDPRVAVLALRTAFVAGLFPLLALPVQIPKMRLFPSPRGQTGVYFAATFKAVQRDRQGARHILFSNAAFVRLRPATEAFSLGWGSVGKGRLTKGWTA